MVPALFTTCGHRHTPWIHRQTRPRFSPVPAPVRYVDTAPSSAERTRSMTAGHGRLPACVQHCISPSIRSVCRYRPAAALDASFKAQHAWSVKTSPRPPKSIYRFAAAFTWRPADSLTRSHFQFKDTGQIAECLRCRLAVITKAAACRRINAIPACAKRRITPFGAAQAAVGGDMSMKAAFTLMSPPRRSSR